MTRALLSLLVVGSLSGLITLRAQNGPDGPGDPGAPAQQPDGQYEPGRAVARISVVNGDVSVRRGDSGDVVAAAVNGPLMIDDRILTSSSARAEVQLDAANMIRIGPNAEVRFTGMDTHSFQVQVAAGTVTFRTLRPGEAQVEVDTPSVAVRPMQPGAYRVTVHEDGSSEITVRSGEAEIDSQRGGERLDPGRTMNARGPAADPEFQMVQAIPLDNFDRWNDERDRFIENSQSARHMSPDIPGGEDMDHNGQWVNDPSYGQVWQPNVGPGWAPYQNGQWVWEDYYGWTWVSYDPWGWAPYHYGRWFMGAGGWAWYPGPIFAHPYWAPAYVGFFGFGGGLGVGVGFGFGGVGWVALAPFEVVHPWWGRGVYGGFASGALVNRTTIINNGNVAGAYRNARVAGGAVGMNTSAFGRGGQITALNRSQIQSAGLVRGVLPVAPDRSSLRMSNRAVSGRYPQTAGRTFASRMQTAHVEHASFTQQQRGMEQMSRGNFTRGAAGRGGFGGGAAESHGWSRFGEPIHGTSNGYSRGSYGGSAGGSERYNYAGRSGASSYGYARGGQAVRVNPSIVARPNSAPRSSGSGSRGYGGARPSGGGHASSGGHGGHR
ncbi:MAG TPA: FecR family protein [Bryobacteraceae bacterium]|nr:FecR family protein [Bryobacteraceae bacterium]